jgi:hypothetical protein
MEKIFQYKFKFYVLKQTLYEPDEIFFERINYMINNINLKNITFEQLERKSLLISNLKNYGCEYDLLSS